MKISVKESGGFHFNLYFPSALVLNPVAALFAPRLMEKNGITMDRSQAAAFIRAINQYRRRHHGWVLVEASTADGTSVEIRI